ncbi:esterase [Paenibacillus selenitireducens]|uniref:Esterase n=1 Tax=Paenibacillus selenitireducens TaxID=1324314 RepID=A0A1T2X3D6_9BACL|nr:esterase [Paenibacillus selenitireducens]
MNYEEEVNELTEKFEEVKKAANRTSNWRERLQAVEELGQWNQDDSIRILMRLMNHDPVYTVQEAAYHKLRALGEDVKLPSKNKQELVKGISKLLLRIKKSLPKDHTYEEFKEKLRKMRIDVYDMYEGEKGADFDKWLEKMWASSSPNTK